MDTPLTAQRLAEITAAAKQRIYKETYASPEEVRDYFEREGNLPQYIDQHKGVILEAANKGLCLATLYLTIPNRIFKSLHIYNESNHWETFQEQYPDESEVLLQYIQKIADVKPRAIGYTDGDSFTEIHIEVMWGY